VKLGKIVLGALAIIVAFVYQILANAAPAYLPKFSWGVFWGVIVASLILVTILLSIWQNQHQNKQPLPLTQRKSKQSSKSVQHLQTLQPLQQSPFLPTETEKNIERDTPRNSSHPKVVEEGQPTVEHPALLGFALDVSDTMIDSVIDHAGKTVKRWANIQTVLDRFIYLGAAFVKDPETRRVLPLYHTIAYGFGFAERAHLLGISKKPGGAVRDLLAQPSLPALPSVAQLTDHWDEYKEHFTSKRYTLDLLGNTPLCQALATIRDRIGEELTQKSFVLPVLLLIVSDGIPTDGDPLPLILELHEMGVHTLCCYLGEQDILNAKQLYGVEDARWSEGAKCMFRMASALRKDCYLSRAMFDYLSDTGWHPQEGARLFAQINHSEALDSFLKVLLSGFIQERNA
jgi:hypothetical protein